MSLVKSTELPKGSGRLLHGEIDGEEFDCAADCTIRVPRGSSLRLRPLWYDYPDREEFYQIANQFLLGSDLLAAPVLEENQIARDILLAAAGGVARCLDGANLPTGDHPPVSRALPWAADFPSEGMHGTF